MTRNLMVPLVALLLACGGNTSTGMDTWSDEVDALPTDILDSITTDEPPLLDILPDSMGETATDIPDIQPDDTPVPPDDTHSDAEVPDDANDVEVSDPGPDAPVYYCPTEYECGKDAEGRLCGVCPNDWPCVEHRCQCQPICAGVCGGDLCGGSCGDCGTGAMCDQGACVAPACQEGFVAIPAGTFEMGSPYTEKFLLDSTLEVQRTVTLTHAFCIQATELTQGQWTDTMAGNISTYAECGLECPQNMNWFEAAKFCNERSKKEGLAECFQLEGCTGDIGKDYACTSVTFAGLDCPGYRLPISAEWEYAARAGTVTATYNGDLMTNECAPNTVLDPIAWFCGNSNTMVHPVRQKAPNPWGLYDVLGNMLEWCIDYSPLTTPPFWFNIVDPFRPPPHNDQTVLSYAVVRGGSSWDLPDSLRAGLPLRLRPWARGNLGLRLVRTMKAP